MKPFNSLTWQVKHVAQLEASSEYRVEESEEKPSGLPLGSGHFLPRDASTSSKFIISYKSLSHKNNMLLILILMCHGITVM